MAPRAMMQCWIAGSLCAAWSTSRCQKGESRKPRSLGIAWDVKKEKLNFSSVVERGRAGARGCGIGEWLRRVRWVDPEQNDDNRFWASGGEEVLAFGDRKFES